MNTSCAGVMVFFVMLASNATPILATAIALSYAVPFSNNYSWYDAGCPPSWNGRLRVRWGEEPCFARGIFAGRYRLKPGKTGTSFPRCGILLAAGWLTWAWKPELRRTLEFGKEREISEWVKWVAIFGFGMSVLVLWVQAVGYSRIGHRRIALLVLPNTFLLIGLTFLFGWSVARGNETWQLALMFFEGGVTLLGTLIFSVVLGGVALQNGALVLWSKFVWIFLVLLSCFNG
jgi:hypothetical protein